MNNFVLSTPAEETTLWEDIGNYIYEIFTGADGYYVNLGLDPTNVMSVSLIVFGLFVGTILACIAMTYNKQVLGGFVRRLIDSGCNSAESAKTLEAIGVHKNPFIRSAVQNNVSLRRVVRCVEEDEFYQRQARDKELYEQKREQEPQLPKFKELEYRVDPSADHFYIPEASCEMAEKKFYARGSSWRTLIIAIIILSIACFAIMLALPKILTVLDQFVGGFRGSDPYGR